MNYSTQVGNPTAHITKKKSRLKLYNGSTVHLNDGDNFEIELYNPKTTLVLAKIKLNGEYISGGGIVLKPGQRVFLERFLDTNNKFVYNTYEVKDNSQNRDAIAFNGDITIEFYDKYTPSPVYYGNTITLGYPYPHGSTCINSGTYLGGNLTYTSNASSVINLASSNTTNIGSSQTSSISTSNFSNLLGTPRQHTKQLSSGMKRSKKSIETGMVEKGEQSSQKFQQTSDTFNTYTCFVENFKILPLSQLITTSKNLTQFCSQCGKKQKKENKFCPDCGNDLSKVPETKITYTDRLTINVNGKIYSMQSFNVPLHKLIEYNSGKTIIVNKSSLSEDYVRAIIY